MEAVHVPPRSASDRPERLQEAEAQLRQFVETIPTVAWYASPSGEFEFFTKYFQEYTGLAPEEYLGWGWTSAIHPDDLPALLSAWTAIRASGEPGNLDCRVRRHNGEYRFVAARVVPFTDEAGKICGWYGCSEDIEEHKRTEQRQRSGAEELCNVIDAIAELIAVVNPDGNLTYINDEFRRYAGLPVGQYEYDRIRAIVFHPDELEAMRVERLNGFEKGTRFVTEHRICRHDGQFRWHQIRYSPLKNATHEIIRWYATGIDIHEEHIAAARLNNENFALREEITRSSMFEEIVGSSKPMERVLASVVRVAPSASTVLITGETGTGKELIARAVHNHSARRSKAFIRVNCAAIPASLVASELFGHEKGAFTGALQRRIGRFEAADGGTLFLDEIGDLPLETQVSLLRVLQEHEFERIGSNTSITVDVRVVAATHVDLPARVAAGTFRRDLFYRLMSFPFRCHRFAIASTIFHYWSSISAGVTRAKRASESPASAGKRSICVDPTHGPAISASCRTSSRDPSSCVRTTNCPSMPPGWPMRLQHLPHCISRWKPSWRAVRRSSSRRRSPQATVELPARRAQRPS